MDRHRGFTVIEVMLFLAITGVIMATLLTGVSVGLNRERYHDAVSSFADFMRGQYNDTVNVNNSRPQTDVCGASGIIVGGGTTSSPIAGASDGCTVVGQLVTSSADGQTVGYQKLYATVDALTLPRNDSDTDTQILSDAGLVADPKKETYNMGWSSRLVGAGSENNTPLRFSIVIVRMPTSGLVHTYVLREADKKPSEVIASGTTSTDYLMCVDTAGLTGTKAIGVVLQANAVNSGGVNFVPEGTC